MDVVLWLLYMQGYMDRNKKKQSYSHFGSQLTDRKLMSANNYYILFHTG